VRINAKAAFTLTELLAVMAIGLILVAGSIGVLVALASSIGPSNAAAELQSMLNAARSYAASEKVSARLVLKTDASDLEHGTVMKIEYLPAGKTNWTSESLAVPNRPSVSLGRSLFVLSLSTSDLTSLPTAPAAPADARNPTVAEQTSWRNYRAGVLSALKGKIYNPTGTPKPSVVFYVYFDPSGYLSLDVAGQATTTPIVLVIMQVGGNQVTEYMFYPLNPNTGTRLVFE